MTFGYPFFLLALLLLPLLALLYVRRAGRRERVVPSLALWQTVARGASAEAGRRLGALDLSLGLAMFFLAAVILAASDPVLTAPAGTAPRLLVLADRSASMAGRAADGSSRWERSVADVIGLLDRLDGGTVTLVGLPLAAGPVLDGLSPADARARLRDLGPTDLPLDLGPELARYAGLAAYRASAVLVLTDDPGPVPERLGGVPVLVFSQGGPSQNVAIDAFEVSRQEDGTLAVFLSVKNHSGRAAAVRVNLTGGRSHKVPGPPLGGPAAWTLGPGATQTLIRDALDGRLARVDATLQVDDSLDSDNRAVATRSGLETVRVAYVGRSSPFVVRALEQLPGVRLSQFRLARDLSGEFDLTLFDAVTPGTLPPGDTILIDPVGRVGPFTVRGAISDPAGLRVVKVGDSPLLRHVDVAALRFKRLARIGAGPEATPLLAAADDAALLRWADGGRRVTVIACGLVPAETNWPLLASFPIFWANVVADLSARHDPARGGLSWTPTGRRVVVRQPVGAALVVTGPDGRRALRPGRGARTGFRPGRAGLHTVSGGREPQWFAVNMLHPDESACGGALVRPSARLCKAAIARGRGAGVRLWRYLATAALVFALAYWAVAARSRG